MLIRTILIAVDIEIVILFMDQRAHEVLFFLLS
jgi:hypothetical protein